MHSQCPSQRNRMRKKSLAVHIEAARLGCLGCRRFSNHNKMFFKIYTHLFLLFSWPYFYLSGWSLRLNSSPSFFFLCCFVVVLNRIISSRFAINDAINFRFAFSLTRDHLQHFCFTFYGCAIVVALWEIAYPSKWYAIIVFAACFQTGRNRWILNLHHSMPFVHTQTQICCVLASHFRSLSSFHSWSFANYWLNMYKNIPFLNTILLSEARNVCFVRQKMCDFFYI